MVPGPLDVAFVIRPMTRRILAARDVGFVVTPPVMRGALVKDRIAGATHWIGRRHIGNEARHWRQSL